MKSLLELIIEKNSDLINTEDYRYYLVGSNGGLEVCDNFNIFLKLKSGSDIIYANELGVNQFIVAKSAKGLSESYDNMHIIILLETPKSSVIWEDENLAKITYARLVKVIDGYQLLRRFGQGLDLSGANLRGANLRGANLQGALLAEADCQGADFERANLQDAVLTGANLHGCNFSCANLTNATLDKADMRRSNLRQSDLRGTKWKGTALRGAELWDAYIWGVKFDEAFTEGLDISRADNRGS